MASSKKVPLPRIAELAAIITASVDKLGQILSDHHAPWPSFEEDAPAHLPKEASEFQGAVLDATKELHDLLLEPLSLIYKNTSAINLASIQAIGRFHIASMVPAGGQTSYGSIAKQIGLSEQMTRRLLRHAMTLHIFREPEPGFVGHTQTSRLLRDPENNAFLDWQPEVGWPSSLKLVDALQKWPGSEEPDETAFSLANPNGGSIYNIFSQDPERALKFARGMKVFGDLPEFNISNTVQGYDWAALGQAQVVDVGGSQGKLAIALAGNFPGLNLVVQDMEKVVEGAQDSVPLGLRSRVRLMAHDFFTPQTVHADVYVFRTILHNWGDTYCVKILRALVPALKPGTRILINDMCLPEPGSIPANREVDLRCMDLNMGAYFNAQERDIHEWTSLLTKADPRFVIKGVTMPADSALAIIEAVWSG
ncbi:6-hydroxytryprostatin B O-methyltransferase [Cytospora mali]|uniref:6-hydroxytryprostatin B O-methyltransferase n=1 Tax=Cytospora mali TaxID=578113 RepID=A0A194VW62_CYTMA|nr:6-hydroxytryprostatin B O-methyltransferase [Valsa mali]